MLCCALLWLYIDWFPPYLSGLLHWHCGNLTIAPVPAKQPWWIWINTSCEFIMNDCITTTKQSTTKPCAYFLGYTVQPHNHALLTSHGDTEILQSAIWLRSEPIGQWQRSFYLKAVLPLVKSLAIASDRNNDTCLSLTSGNGLSADGTQAISWTIIGYSSVKSFGFASNATLVETPETISSSFIIVCLTPTFPHCYPIFHHYLLHHHNSNNENHYH